MDTYLKFDDKKIINTDPNSLTIPELKSILSSRIELRASREKKEFYVNLYKKLVQDLLNQQKNLNSFSPPPVKETTVQTRSRTPIQTPVSPIISTPTQVSTPKQPTERPIIPKIEPLTSPPIKHSTSPSIELPTSPSLPEKNDFIRWMFAILIFLLWGIQISYILLVMITHPYYFCDGVSATRIANSYQECIPCPVHAICKYGSIESCEEGYEKYYEYSQMKYTCTEDASLIKEAKKIIRIIKTELSIQKGKYKCKMSEEDSLSLKEIEYLILEISHYSSSAFNKALEIIETSDNYGISFIEVPNIPNGGILKLENAEEAIFPLSCSIKLFIAAYKSYLIFSTLFIVITLYYIRRIKKMKEEEEVAIQVSNLVHSFLQSQKLISSSKSDSNFPYVPIIHVRDSIFPPNFVPTTFPLTEVTIGDTTAFLPSDIFKSTRKRDSIWGKVEKLIEKDSRIKLFTMMVHGQQQSVWEWEAPILHKSISTPKNIPMQSPPTKQIFQRHPEIYPQRSFAHDVQ